MDRAIQHLLSTGDRFYAEILLQMDRVWTQDPAFPTLGVSIKQRPVTLQINRTFWNNNTSLEVRVFLLKHECAHIIADHGARANGPFTPLHNIAADIAVHELVPVPKIPVYSLEGLVVESCVLASYKTMIPGLEPNRTMEYYYDALLRAGEGGGEGIDDHSGLEAADEVQQAAAREVVQRAVNGCRQAGQSIPHELRKLVDDLLGTAVDWRRELRNFPQCAEVCDVESSRRIRNRRYGLQFPGDKKTRRVNIAVGFDVSGSIGAELATAIASEISHIVKGGAEVDVLFFDTDVVEVRPWSDNFLDTAIPGGGGTAFQPALDAGRDRGADGIIMLTDGCNFDTITDPGIPVIWAILPGFKFTCAFGTVVELKDEAD